MTSPDEVTAAATGAAAAVAAVQEESAQEQQVERAEEAAEIAADTAVSASVSAEEATEAATAAVQQANAAAEGVEALGATTSVALTDVYERIGRVETEQKTFIEEARGFFGRLEEQIKPKDSGVQQVEVTNATSNAQTQSAEGTSENSANGRGESSNSGNGSKARRKRFGGLCTYSRNR